MSATEQTAMTGAGSQAIPALSFAVEGCAPQGFAASPTLVFSVRIDAGDQAAIRSIVLGVQIQIAARQRGYDSAAQERLLELFGLPERWGSTLRTLPWLRTTLVVPPFEGSTVVELPVTCTYDTEVIAARYLASLEDGMVPLELLFTGSFFYSGAAGALQTARIGWESEANYRLPVAVWRETMDRHFPDSAWLRLGRSAFDRLSAYKARGAFMSWDAAIDALLTEEGQ